MMANLTLVCLVIVSSILATGKNSLHVDSQYDFVYFIEDAFLNPFSCLLSPNFFQCLFNPCLVRCSSCFSNLLVFFSICRNKHVRHSLSIAFPIIVVVVIFPY